jgi:hypothetical protein
MFLRTLLRTLLLSLLLTQPLLASVSWQDPHWHISAKTSRVERYLGREALFLDSGYAWLDGVDFENGTIEFDLASPVEAGFHGLAFRALSHEDHEHVYVRPHLSGKQDAVQYLPVFHGLSTWQLYSGPRYVQPATFVPDRWMHIRAIIRGKRLELSVDGQTVVFPELVRPSVAGPIALTASAGPTRFANLVITPGETGPPEGGDGGKADETPVAVITQWRVSTPFPESVVLSSDVLKPAASASLRWDPLDISVRGIANLGALRKLTEGANTVFAAVTLRAQKAGPVRVRFGFSDRAVVYLDGRPLYRGNAKFQSRDYRFLGTVGLYDELFLLLHAGDNHVWIAVSEDFGGWGVTMQLPDAGGPEVIAHE